MDYRQILARLCALPGPSGFEEAVAQGALELLRPLVDRAWIDRMGNLIGVRRCGIPGAKILLLDAHLDEIGFLITGHQDGFLRFTQVGGVDVRMLPDRELTILTQPPIVGVVSCLPPHIQQKEDFDKAIPMEELFLDVGLSQEEALQRIPVGTPAVYREGCTLLGKHLLCGKALDDRACFAILLDTLHRLKDVSLDIDLYVVGSTQEETHSTGAITAAYGIAPDGCVAVDVTHGDSPDASNHKTFPLGKGPVLGIGPNGTPWMTKCLEQLAENENIPIQKEVMSGSSGTNGWPIQILREGIPTAVLSLPLRYMHTPVETAHTQDMAQIAQLLAAFVRAFGEEVTRL